ncbi:MAG: hypothetical protein K9N06_09970 [Candidatus Cloacimonetes bacterium]|nr:hypothetical protein [Candidatus Cloacimonadota bacterium]
MKIKVTLFLLLAILNLIAVIIPYESLTPQQQAMVMPDLNGLVNCTQEFLDYIPEAASIRVLPTLAEGWPLTFTSSNCYKGAIYTNMDADEELEILYGVGTKIVAVNIDGSAVNGWPQQLGYYIWSSPACGDIDGDGEDEIVGGSRNNTNGNIGVLYAFEKSGAAVEGFPVTMAGGGTMNASLADIDDDGDLEIFVNVRNHPNGWTYVFDGDGSVFPGFPQQLDTFPGSGISVGDITGDDIPEIVGLSYNSLWAFDIAGNVLDGFPVSQPGYNYSYSQPILADIDDDGLREIIYGGCSNGGACFVVRNDGTNADGWPQTVDQWVFANPALADLDGDGDLEIIIGDQVSSGTPIDHIYAWHGDGSALNGFPAGPTNAIYAQVGIADLDGDELPEIMIDDNVFANGYDCYNDDGTHCDDWPLPAGTGWDSVTMQMTPVFGDLDLDGYLEIMGAATGFTSWIVELCFWNTESLWNEELAYMPLDGCNIQHSGVYPQELLPPPEAPSECTATIFDYNNAIIAWVLEDAGQIAFNVYRDNTFLATLDSDIRELYEYDLGNCYFEYNITAVYENGESDFSPTAVVNINLLPPVNLFFENLCTIVNLYWSPPPSNRDLTAYNVYRNSLLVGTVTDTIYTEENLPEDIYEYYVTAVYSDIYESEPSESVNIEVVPVNDDDISAGNISISNYPNPFNPVTMISFTLQQDELLEISIFNSRGQLIRQFGSEFYISGQHTLLWNGKNDNETDMASGLYLLKCDGIYTGVTHKLMLLK